MASCCGGGAGVAEFIRLKQQLSGQQTVMVAQGANRMVRMEFTGETQGPITFRPNGHEYRGAASPFHRYADVDPNDVEQLVITGKWKVVSQPEPLPPTRDVDTMVFAEVAAAPVVAEKSPAELRAEAAATLASDKDALLAELVDSINETKAAAVVAAPVKKTVTPTKRARK